MGRKKSRTPPSSPPPRQEPFHSPFQGLKEQLRAMATAPPPSPPPPPPPAPAATVRPARPSNAVTRQDTALFLGEMTGVTPLPKDPRGRVDKPQQPTPQGLFPTDELEALAVLRDLVEGRGAFTIQYTDEYMEGIAPGVDQR